MCERLLLVEGNLDYKTAGRVYRPLPLPKHRANQALPPLRAMSVVYSRRLKKELQEIQIEQADPAKRAAGASRHPQPSRAPQCIMA